MFADVMTTVMSLAFPDVCKVPTPAGPVPVPFPNVMPSTRLPVVPNLIIGGGMALNLLSTAPVSNGDEAGVATGVLSSTVVGPGRTVVGSGKTIFGCAPATRLTSITAQNGMVPNAPGVTLAPGQFRVMTLV